jgi:hypothetical protein
MIWMPDGNLWLPTESRFGPWYRRARQWRASLSLNAQNELTYGTGGHLQYSGTQGGHLMYGCTLPLCGNCDVGTIPSTIIGTFSSTVTCTGAHAGAITISGGYNGTYTFSRNITAGNLCLWEYCEAPGVTVSGTGGGGTGHMGLYMWVNHNAGSFWRILVFLGVGGQSCPSTTGISLVGVLFTADGSLNTDCSASFTVTNSLAACNDFDPIPTYGHGGSFSGTPVL